MRSTRSPLSRRLLAWTALVLLPLAACQDDDAPTEATITDAPTPEIATFAATPEQLAAGEQTTLTWAVSDATEITIRAEDRSVELQLPGASARQGSAVIIPRRTSTYTLTARNNPGGNLRPTTASAQVSVAVAPGAEDAPTVALTVSPTAIVRGETAELTWSTTDADAVSITANGEPLAVDEALPTSGSLEVSPQTTTTFALTATGPGGETTASVELQVEDAQPDAPRITAFTATPDTLPAEGGQVTLAWTTQSADAITLTDTLGENIDLADARPEDGSVNLNITLDTTFTLTATGPGGETTRTLRVALEAPALAPEITAFALEGDRVLIGAPATLSFATTHATDIALFAGEAEIALPEDLQVDGDEITVTLEQTTTFTLVATGPGGSDSEELTVAAVEPVTIDTFSVAPTVINAGEGVFLQWTTSGATSVIIYDGEGNRTDPGAFDIDGNFWLGPFEDITYVLVARGPGGEARAQMDVQVDNTPRVTFRATPDTVQPGESTTLSWETISIFNLQLVDERGNMINIINEPTRAGSVVVTPTQTTTYILSGPGPGGDGYAEATVTVQEP